MQYILSEEEYKKLIHKERILNPVKEFIRTIKENCHEASYPSSDLGLVEIKQEVLSSALTTLSIKLDL